MRSTAEVGLGAENMHCIQVSRISFSLASGRNGIIAPHARMTEKTNANPRFKKSRQARVRENAQANQARELLLNAITSENTRQAMRLRNMGDVQNVVTVNEEVQRYPLMPQRQIYQRSRYAAST